MCSDISYNNFKEAFTLKNQYLYIISKASLPFRTMLPAKDNADDADPFPKLMMLLCTGLYSTVLPNTIHTVDTSLYYNLFTLFCFLHVCNPS